MVMALVQPHAPTIVFDVSNEVLALPKSRPIIGECASRNIASQRLPQSMTTFNFSTSVLTWCFRATCKIKKKKFPSNNQTNLSCTCFAMPSSFCCPLLCSFAVILLYLHYVLSLPLPLQRHPLTSRSSICPVSIPNDPPSASDFASASPRDSHNRFPRIVNGDFVSEALRPYLASLLILVSLNRNTSCSAILVSPRWLITAAHCIDSPNILVSVGTNRSLKYQKQPFLRVQENVTHSRYNSSQMQYDIAALRLTRPAPSGAKFMKVNVKSTLPAVGSFVRSAGYGRTDREGDPKNISGFLRQVDIPVTSECACQSAYSTPSVDYAAQVCAGYARGECSAWYAETCLVQTDNDLLAL